MFFWHYHNQFSCIPVPFAVLAYYSNMKIIWWCDSPSVSAYWCSASSTAQITEPDHANPQPEGFLILLLPVPTAGPDPLYNLLWLQRSELFYLLSTYLHELKTYGTILTCWEAQLSSTLDVLYNKSFMPDKNLTKHYYSMIATIRHQNRIGWDLFLKDGYIVLKNIVKQHSARPKTTLW
jgi:hypothetical protein